MSRRSWLPAVLAVLPLAGCTVSPTTTIAGHTRSAMRLVAFDSCARLQAELRAATRAGIGPYGLDGGSSELPAGARAMVTDQAAPKAAPTYSGTNVQEQGVDEPDIVKTDGRRIVTVIGTTLSVVDAATRARTGKLDLAFDAGGPAQLLLSGDRALVLVSGGGYRGRGGIADMKRPAGNRSEVILVDLSGPSPRLLSRYRGDGLLIDAREQGGVARVVLSSTPQITFPFRSESNEGLLEENRKAVDAAPVDAWLPTWEVTTDGRTTSGKLDCGAVSRPDAFSGTAMLRVLTFNLAEAGLGDGSPVAVVADGDAVYGTATSLYVANNQDVRLNAWPEAATMARVPRDTEIFRFDLPPAGKPVYAAAGKVPGMLLNQYSMSEWDGHLRVATTDSAEQSSAVRVLREDGGKLTQVGDVSGLGQGEKIYSVRFDGPRGYVVTFRQTDPLYSLDLADPARPRVTGELKITGFSAHLQPVGENRLIGIGQEASTQGAQTGTQLSLFDVADPAKPQRLAQQFVEGGQSEAEFDPHALLWWPATGLLVMPYSDASSSGALAVRVTADGLRPLGKLAAQDATTPIRRALVVGDVLWTVTDDGLLASNLSTLDKISWVGLN